MRRRYVRCSSFWLNRHDPAMRKWVEDENWQLVWWRRWTRLRCVIVPLHTRRKNVVGLTSDLWRAASVATPPLSPLLVPIHLLRVPRSGRGLRTVVGCVCFSFGAFVSSFYFVIPPREKVTPPIVSSIAHNILFMFITCKSRPLIHSVWTLRSSQPLHPRECCSFLLDFFLFRNSRQR